MQFYRDEKQFLKWILVFGTLGMLVSFKVLKGKDDTRNLQQPNILWLVAEDLSPYIPSFGDSTIQTPNLSRLAAEGVRYTNVFDISGVCAPSRAALITGMYPSSIGAHHMRTIAQQPAAKKWESLIMNVYQLITIYASYNYWRFTHYRKNI